MTVFSGIRDMRPAIARVLLISACVTIPFLGCDSLNPAFVTLLDAETANALASIDNGTGPIIITFINNAQIEEQTLAYMLANLDGLSSIASDSIKPAVRMRLLVTYQDGTEASFQYAVGTAELVEVTDFAESVVSNVVFPCDVVQVELDPDRPIEVYIPVEIAVYELVEATGVGGAVTTEFEIRERIAPGFQALEVDDVDEDNYVTLQRNFAPGDTPAPVSPYCGSVVAFVLEGEFSVPFLTGEDDSPSYDRDDESTVAGVGGRYRFVTEIK